MSVICMSFIFLWIGEIGASGPDGQDGGKLGQAAPFFDDVVDVEGACHGKRRKL